VGDGAGGVRVVHETSANTTSGMRGMAPASTADDVPERSARARRGAVGL